MSGALVAHVRAQPESLARTDDETRFFLSRVRVVVRSAHPDGHRRDAIPQNEKSPLNVNVELN